MTNTLAEILAHTRDRLPALEASRTELRARAASALPGPPWSSAFGHSHVAIVAEVKRRSPSAGSIARELDPVPHSKAYADGGAAAISVLTDARHFGGSLNDLAAVRGAVSVPLLRKDFIIHPLQLYESRAASASAVLLIMSALEGSQLLELLQLAEELDLGTLVEVHTERELDGALTANARCIGVNARDLATFRVDVASTEHILRAVPGDVIAVAESGLTCREDVEHVARWGADAVLIGAAASAAADPSAFVSSLTGVERHDRS